MHDGFFSGKPEPVLLVGIYLIHPCGTPPSASCALQGTAVTRCLGRVVARFAPNASAPLRVLPAGDASVDHRITAHQSDRLLILGVAMEEDVGYDVGQCYTHLSEPDSLLAWSRVGAVPDPLSLAKHALNQACEAPNVLEVELLLGAKDLRDVFTDDEVVAAGLTHVPAATLRDSIVRMHLVSPDRKNDWTAVMGLDIK